MVAQLDDLVQRKKLGIVAHFYMDPELQGVLSALKWPHTFIADSLAMGEAAVQMAEQGVRAVTVLGVDFMSESVRGVCLTIGHLNSGWLMDTTIANLDSNGFHDIPVYRLSEKYIGCSLAEAAERQAYAAYLTRAAETPKSLHVVYSEFSVLSLANGSLLRVQSIPRYGARLSLTTWSRQLLARHPMWSKRFCRPSRRYPT